MNPLDDLLARKPELAPLEGDITAAFDLLAETFESGHKLLACGNGGSSADAGHIVGELMKGMVHRRRLSESEVRAFDVLSDASRDYLIDHLEGALPAIDLGSQQALLSAISNDTAGDIVFAQQVYGYGVPGDTLWGLSTSGNLRNVVLAAATARARQVRVLALTGPRPSKLSELADVAIKVPGDSVQTIQEYHLPIYHALCEMLESRFFHPAVP